MPKSLSAVNIDTTVLYFYLETPESLSYYKYIRLLPMRWKDEDRRRYGVNSTP